MISMRDTSGVRVITLDGRLDTGNAGPALEQMADALGSEPQQVLVNLEALEFVSSAGLRVILRSAKQVKAYQGVFKVCSARGMVKEVLEISGFDSLLDMYDNEVQALAAFG